MFYRLNDQGNAEILENDGYAVTRLPFYNIYPVGGDLSVSWEHPEGIVLTVSDAERCGINAE